MIEKIFLNNIFCHKTHETGKFLSNVKRHFLIYASQTLVKRKEKSKLPCLLGRWEIQTQFL